jgi:hypothetical protein
VAELKGYINKEDNIMDNNVEQVDWDKVNRGKVRYGFALELYKKGGELTLSGMGWIEAFVDFVMGDMEDEPVEEKQQSKLMSKAQCEAIIKMEAEGSKAFVKAMVHVDAEGLEDDDLEKVLQALKTGKITMDNLQASLDKIYTIKQSYK